MRLFFLAGTIISFCLAGCRPGTMHPIVIQTDFGLSDGAVNAMKGVAIAVDPKLELFDLTHDIPPYNTWEAAYRLHQVAAFWPPGTVFVSVVDPGVGTGRRSVVMRTKTGHYFVTPDNGTLTLVADMLGIDALRQIDEATNRRENSDSSYTFHGRDVYAYTAARLAAGKIRFEEVGPMLDTTIVRLDYQQALFDATRLQLKGNIPVLDPQYGNVWTNIHDSLVRRLNINHGDSLEMIINKLDSVVFKGIVGYARTFADVPEGKSLAYLNSLMNLSLAVNMGNFAKQFGVGSGPEWSLSVRKLRNGKK